MAKILLVEDEPSVMELLKFSLEAEGHMVVQADTGRKALDWIKEVRFDLAILDLNLPDMHGTQVCMAIKEEPRSRLVPVMILTGNSSNEAKLQSTLEAKADLFLNKPINTADLKRAVKSLLEIAEKRKLLLRNSLKTKFGEI